MTGNLVSPRTTLAVDRQGLPKCPFNEVVMRLMVKGAIAVIALLAVAACAPSTTARTDSGSAPRFGSSASATSTTPHGTTCRVTPNTTVDCFDGAPKQTDPPRAASPTSTGFSAFRVSVLAGCKPGTERSDACVFGYLSAEVTITGLDGSTQTLPSIDGFADFSVRPGRYDARAVSAAGQRCGPTTEVVSLANVAVVIKCPYVAGTSIGTLSISPG